MNPQHTTRVDFAGTVSEHSPLGLREVMTCQEVGEAIGLSKTTVQRIEKEAIAKLRVLLMARGITAADLR